MKILYKASATSAGGRDGKVSVENSALQFDMALPAELGGAKKNGVNPEQLFAAGYSACFGSAVQHVLHERKLNIPVPTVHITVGIGQNEDGGFALEAEINVIFKGVDQITADSIAKEAHLVCPYSNATRGNMTVMVSAKAE
jgi:Ohr subfamily peroxiredoxin